LAGIPCVTDRLQSGLPFQHGWVCLLGTEPLKHGVFGGSGGGQTIA
jgi:hypothetical protein